MSDDRSVSIAPSSAGYLTVYPCGEDRPLASNVNYTAGAVVPNAVLAKVGVDGKVCIFTLADTTFAYACNSRGLTTVAAGVDITFVQAAYLGDVLVADARVRANWAVSYTHLTLPTIYSV
mgnify:CR=1 FL=1